MICKPLPRGGKVQSMGNEPEDLPKPKDASKSSWVRAGKAMRQNNIKHIGFMLLRYSKWVVMVCVLSACGLYAGQFLRAQSSPYINRVWEYRPAPGQFVNELPQYEAGDTENDIRLKAEDALADDARGLVSLGGWGGYIVFSFDHTIVNIEGEYDFRILGNAFYSTSGENSKQGGSAEPGIVYVSYDSNQNGKPDDEWYELAGSEYEKAETIHGYSVTYYRPSTDHVATPDNDNKYLIDTTYIRWEDNQEGSGYINQVSFHQQSYFPLWLSTDELSFTGTRLADNYKDESGNGSYYVLYAYDYGYADNKPNDDDGSKMKIDWAVTTDGTPVSLPGIDFVKVMTGVNQQCGWIGETSTEVMGAIDLHPLTGLQEVRNTILLTTFVSDKIMIISDEAQQVRVSDAMGREMFSAYIQSGTSALPCTRLPQGIYLLHSNNSVLKFLKR